MSSTNFFLFAISIFSIEMTFGWQCHFETTPYNSDGGGNMVYLDRHYLNCGKRGMVRFHLDRSGGSIRYEYFCCDIPAETPGKSISHTNAFTADGNGNTVYLDRETVDCGPSAILTAYHLERNSDHNAVHYVFSCLQFADVGPLTCYDFATPYEFDGNGNVVYLDRLDVECKDGYFLNRFHLDRSGGGDSWGYRVRCCHPWFL